MITRIAQPIRLETKYGDLQARHVLCDEKEGVALIGMLEFPNPILVRVQSSCLFSESFWATGCDCDAQLKTAIQSIIAEGGMLLYMYEEGRGAGLYKKMEAIRIQQTSGYGTKDAYRCLSLAPDPRTYDAAGRVLSELVPNGYGVTLLTNNEAKVEGLLRAGVNIVRRRSLICRGLSGKAEQELEEKETDFAHILKEGEESVASNANISV